MNEFFFRTEDLKPEEVIQYFVETRQDRIIVDALKARSPTILVGSRGVGKSFLLRVAQHELINSFEVERVFPVYLSFVRSSLLTSKDPQQFTHWMLARICTAVIRSLMKQGLLGGVPKSINSLAGEKVTSTIQKTKVEIVAEAYEDSWMNPDTNINAKDVPTVDGVKEALEDLATELGIKRFVLLIDEAAHIFVPEQQRQFFTLFRDLRTHFMTCNAAVYPGVTSFGDSFQPAHDASMISIDRDVMAPDYVDNMREIVEKQADSGTMKFILQNGQNFAVLAFAASGNPRALLKTLSLAPKLTSTEVNIIIREYYRNDIWSEHSNLSEKYSGHRPLIDWGRTFVEGHLLPEMKSKNDSYLSSEKSTSAFFWIHRDAPEIVKEALRVLAYTGIVNEQDTGIKASRSEIGQRYIVNLGCLFAQESTPATTSFDIAKSLTPKRMTEYGANHSVFKSLVAAEKKGFSSEVIFTLNEQLTKPVDVLDITSWQKSKLKEIDLNKVGDVLRASEEKLKEAYYVGDVRARRMRNAALAAVFEYLSG